MGTDTTGDVDWAVWDTAHGLADDTDSEPDDTDYEDDLSYEEGF